MSTAARYLVFVRERFPPGAYLPLICVFVAAGYIPSAASSGLLPLANRHWSVLPRWAANIPRTASPRVTSTPTTRARADGSTQAT